MIAVKNQGESDDWLCYFLPRRWDKGKPGRALTSKETTVLLTERGDVLFLYLFLYGCSVSVSRPDYRDVLLLKSCFTIIMEWPCLIIFDILWKLFNFSREHHGLAVSISCQGCFMCWFCQYVSGNVEYRFIVVWVPTSYQVLCKVLMNQGEKICWLESLQLSKTGKADVQA